MHPRFIIFLAILALISGAAISVFPTEQITISDNQFIERLTQQNFSPSGLLEKIEQEISAPTPLRGSMDGLSGTLTRTGILSETNKHRAKENLSALTANTTLNQAAANKLDDMFAQQYFEHISPSGTGPAALVDGVGYAYLRVGENLALGNFASDAELVQAWMDSPGHRANIMADGFSELGVAASKGTFEGEKVWLAVQTFGLPQTACPNPDEKLRTSFDSSKQTATARTVELNQLQEEFEALAEQGQDLIDQGNEKIKEGNVIAAANQSNTEAQTYWDAGGQLQEDGQVLVNQARTKKDSYNEQVVAINQLNEQAQTQVDTLNQQIAAYNKCLEKFK